MYTRFKTMVTQEARVPRLLPLEVVDADDAIATEEAISPPRPWGAAPLYTFEPSPEVVLDALLPRYVANRIYTCPARPAASELAARQRR